MKLKPYALLVIIFLLPYVFMCGQQDESGYTIEIVEGVKHIHNRAPLWGDTLKVALEFVQRIGEIECKDENYLFYMPWDIARDSTGNIYIVDYGNWRIQKFDSNGKYLSTIGRKGQGPGEFSSQPLNIDLNSNGKIYVKDLTFDLFNIITPEGKFVKRFSFSEYGSMFRISNSGNIIISYENFPISYVDNKPLKPVTHSSLIGVFDVESNLLKEFGEPIDFNDNQVTRLANKNYFEIDSDDNIYLTFVRKNQIRKYSPEGKLLIKIEYPIDYKKSYKFTVRKRENIAGDIFVTHMPDFPQVSRNIGIDHKKRIWITTIKKEKDENNFPSGLWEYYIFNSEGILLGRLPMPEINGWMRIFQDRLYLIDSWGEMCVYEYKIVEK